LSSLVQPAAPQSSKISSLASDVKKVGQHYATVSLHHHV